MADKRTDEEMRALDHFAGIALAYLLKESDTGRFMADESILFDSAKETCARPSYDMAEAMLDERQFRLSAD